MRTELIEPREIARVFGVPGPRYLELLFDTNVMRTARKKKAWTQSGLGALLGYTQGWVSSIETGRVTPSVGQMIDVAHALDLCCWAALVPREALVAYLLLVGELEHPSRDARVHWARARVQEHFGDPQWARELDTAAFWERLNNAA